MGRPLTQEKKIKLGEIDAIYKGKIAEREIFLKKQMEEALSAGRFEDAEKVRSQMVAERSRLDEEREDEKERIRRAD